MTGTWPLDAFHGVMEGYIEGAREKERDVLPARRLVMWRAAIKCNEEKRISD